MENHNIRQSHLKAGAAVVNITPGKPYFLFGYPHVERISTGVHDPLLSSALYLSDGKNQVILISNDVIYVSKTSVQRVRETVSARTGIPAGNILIAATHTHSGPVTVDCIFSANDPVVPQADPVYIESMEKGIIRAACQAFQNAVPAEIGFAVADGTGIGTNRHDPEGPADMEIPVVAVREIGGKPVACLLVCNMHPTVLHEDSTLYSSDFPAFARESIQNEFLGRECPVLYFTGAAGNQSPRHVTKENTFEEARRLGGIIARAAVEKLMGGIEYSSEEPVSCLQTFIDLPKRKIPPLTWAQQNQKEAKERFEWLKKNSVIPQEIRTAEVDWFGSEELLSLSRLAESDILAETYMKCLPAEIQVIKIGNMNFVSWPGEIFIEYEISLKKSVSDTYLISLANGELQGYIATKEALEKGYYEASNSLFDFTSGEILRDKTIQLLINNG